jgi:sulfatase modifying factor 1
MSRFGFWSVILAIAFASVGLAIFRVAGCAGSHEMETAQPFTPTPSSVAPTFAPTVENSGRPPGSTPEGMVWIPGGEFSMGAQDPPDINDVVGMNATKDSRPIHRVYVDGFWMDTTDVTNREFAEFVKATGYVTVAERTPKAEDFPDAPPEKLVAGSVVFRSAQSCRPAERLLSVVDVRPRRELASP